jgi:DNA polymerase eta
MRGEEARQLCPQIVLFHTPQKRGKADSSKYREASFEVFDVLTSFHEDIVVEKASIDEAFLDLTKYVNDHRDTFDLNSLDDLNDTYVAGSSDIDGESGLQILHRSILDGTASPDEINLFMGAKMIGKMRKAVFEKTKFHCSAGISDNKIMAKLAAGMNKPSAQTIMTRPNMKSVLNTIEIPKLRHFGGKLGASIVQFFQVTHVGQITDISLDRLSEHFGDKTARFVHDLSNGIDNDQVVSRKLSKSIGCAKNFSAVGTKALMHRDQVLHWITQLVDELLERIERDREMNNRKPTLLIVSVAQTESTSRSIPFGTFEKSKLVESIMEKTLDRLFKENQTKDAIRMLSVSANKFEEIDIRCSTLETFFSKVDRQQYLDNASSSSRSDLKSIDTRAAMQNYFQRVEQELFPTEPIKKPVNTLKACFEAQANRANKLSLKRKASKGIEVDDNSSGFEKNDFATVTESRKNTEIDSNETDQGSSTTIQSEPSASTSRVLEKRGFFFRKTLEFMRKHQ